MWIQPHDFEGGCNLTILKVEADGKIHCSCSWFVVLVLVPMHVLYLFCLMCSARVTTPGPVSLRPRKPSFLRSFWMANRTPFLKNKCAVPGAWLSSGKVTSGSVWQHHKKTQWATTAVPTWSHRWKCSDLQNQHFFKPDSRTNHLKPNTSCFTNSGRKTLNVVNILWTQCAFRVAQHAIVFNQQQHCHAANLNMRCWQVKCVVKSCAIGTRWKRKGEPKRTSKIFHTPPNDLCTAVLTDFFNCWIKLSCWALQLSDCLGNALLFKSHNFFNTFFLEHVLTSSISSASICIKMIHPNFFELLKISHNACNKSTFQTWICSPCHVWSPWWINAFVIIQWTNKEFFIMPHKEFVLAQWPIVLFVLLDHGTWKQMPSKAILPQHAHHLPLGYETMISTATCYSC